MKRAVSITVWLLATLNAVAMARGVSPYLPLNLEPEIERDIERVLILADKPVMKRPIPAAVVLDALPKACAVDAVLCERVRRFLSRYTHDSGISYASAEVAASGGADRPIPNAHGLSTGDHWDADGAVYYQPSDYALVSVGGIAYKGRTEPTGSLLSLGFDRAQLDIGYLDHWLSPMTDASMLMSTEAPTMPSVTLSYYLPFTRLGIEYELFLARMSKSDHILFEGHLTSGNPLLAGFHLSMEPVSGWSIGFNRLLQYGGGGYGGTSIQEVFKAFFDPVAAQNPGANPAKNNTAFGNQEASISSQFIFPAKVPFTVYAVYAGEDTSRGKSYLLGNTAESIGIHFPKLFNRFEFTYEITDFQNLWYVHTIYLDGLVNDGRVTGNWFGDDRKFGDGVGGQTNMMRIGWQPSFGGVLSARYRTLSNATYTGVEYFHAHDLTFEYARPWRDSTVGGSVDAGRDVFGEHFSRLSGFIRFGNEETTSLEAAEVDALTSDEPSGLETFLDAGLNVNRVTIDLSDTIPREDTRANFAPHLGLGARRAVSDHQDLGARLEFDEINHHPLVGVRLIDYRYRFDGPLAVSGFLGAARYALATPATGFYLGSGVQYRNLLPGWDLGMDLRYAVKVARDHLTPSDPTGPRPDSFYDITSATLYLSHRF
jgi:hypothetical protein